MADYLKRTHEVDGRKATHAHGNRLGPARGLRDLTAGEAQSYICEQAWESGETEDT